MWDAAETALAAQVLAAYGEPVQYTPAGGAPITVSGTWHEDAVQSDVRAEVTVSDQQHSVDLRLADLPAEPSPGDQVVSTHPKHAGTYQAVDVQSNGDGWVTLRLHKS